MIRVHTTDLSHYGASSFADDYRDRRAGNSGGTSGNSSAEETAFQGQSVGGARLYGGDGPRSVRVINVNNNVRVITPEAYEHIRQHFHVHAPFLNRADEDVLRHNPHETVVATMDGVMAPDAYDDDGGGLAVPHALRRVATSTPTFANSLSDLRDVATGTMDDMDAATTDSDRDGSPWVGMSPSLSSDSAFHRRHESEPNEILREPGLSIAITRMHLQGSPNQPPQPGTPGAAVMPAPDAPIDCDAYLGPGALNWPDGDTVDATPFLVTLHPPVVPEITDPPRPQDAWNNDAITGTPAHTMESLASATTAGPPATTMFTAAVAAAAPLPPFAFGSGSKPQIGSTAAATTRPPGRLPAPAIVGRRRKTPK